MKSIPTRVQLAVAAVIVPMLLTSLSPAARAGENLEALSLQPLSYTDQYWDRRLYDGTAGFDTSVRWFYNSDAAPPIDTLSFIQTVQSNFRRWAWANAITQPTRVVPVVSIGGLAALAPAAVDGWNAVGWEAIDGPDGILALVQCTYLTRSTTTRSDALGRTILPIGQGAIRFPGPPGVTYAPGALVDCGMNIDSEEAWRLNTDADPSTIDLGAITMHEAGHMLGLAHSTVGLITSDAADDATMIPIADRTSNLRSLHTDDVTSLLRTYLRAHSLDPLTGGFSRITGQLLKNAACDRPAYGVSLRVYQSGESLEAATAQETFSATFLRRQIPGQSHNGRFDINVLPGVEYTVAAILLSNEPTSPYWNWRFNLTTALSNATTPAPTVLDNLARVGPLLPGQTVDVGNIGVLGCATSGAP